MKSEPTALAGNSHPRSLSQEKPTSIRSATCWSVKYYEDIVDDASAVVERLTAETVTTFGTRRSSNCMQSSEGSKEIIPVKNQDDEVSYAIQYRCRLTKQT